MTVVIPENATTEQVHEPLREYVPRRFLYCRACGEYYSLEDPGVEVAYGRPFHVVHRSTAEGEVWERHLLEPLSAKDFRARVN